MADADDRVEHHPWCSGIIRVLGVDQVFLEQGSDARLLLTMDIYDDAGTHIAKLRKNAWAFKNEDYAITTNPAALDAD